MNRLLTELLDSVNRYAELDAAARAASQRSARHVKNLPPDEVLALLDRLQDLDRATARQADALLEMMFEQLRQRFAALNIGSAHSDPIRTRLIALYRHLGPESDARYSLLGVLLALGKREDARAFTELLLAEPPAESKQVLQLLTPLFRGDGCNPALLFPDLLEGLEHVQLAAPLLDLANYVTRSQIVDEHPGQHRAGQLATLLGELAQRLAKLEEDPHVDAATAAQRSRTVDESVALAVSLCDALSLIGDSSVVGKLYQVVQLKHRRLRTEAAAALARLGESYGQQVLLQTAAEPVARLRILNYAEELGIRDLIPEQYSTPVARAEAELALHLAQPTQLGFPPTQLQLVDQRRQFWPSYDEPVDCYLFLFVYQLGDQQYSNVGIVGPLTHSFTANLADLSPADIYATFAGWQAEHEQILEWPADQLTEIQELEVKRLERRIADEGYQVRRSVTFGSFLGEKVLVAKATLADTPGYVVASQSDCLWHPQGPSPRPFSSAEVYYLYKGRKLLKAFNPP